MTALLSVPLTRRLHRVPVVRLLHGGAAERAWSWDWHDQWTREWWPQGISWAGERLLVSWYAKSGGSRVSVLDLETRRYGHVTLLTPAGEPLKIHAGGLAWVDGWLYVAATAKGFWTFHESDLAAVEEVAPQPSRNPATWRATALHRPSPPNGGPPLRWSFLDASGPALKTAGQSAGPAVEEVAQHPSRNFGPTHLYAGEYGRGNRSTRLWRIQVADGQPTGPIEFLGPGPQGMQGVTRTDNGLLVSTSNGPWLCGSLHQLTAIGEVAQSHTTLAVEEVAQQPSRNPNALGGRAARSAGDERASSPRNHRAPIGVEDLTKDDQGHLWTPAEHPGRRAVVRLSSSWTSSSASPSHHR